MRWLALVLVAVAPTAFTAEPLKLSLEQAVDIAVKNSTAVLRAENQTRLTGAQVLQAYAQFLPDFQLGATYGYSSGNTLYSVAGVALVDSNYRAASWLVSSTLNLFNGLNDLSAFKAALQARSSSELSLEFARQQISFDVTQSFLQLVLDQEIVDITKKNLDASEARLKLLRGQTEVGVTSIADLLQQEAQASSDSILLVNAQTRFHDDQLVLLRKMQTDPSTAIEPIQPDLRARSPLVREPADALVERALRARKDLGAVGADIEGARWRVTQARSGYLPRLDLGVQRVAGGRVLITDVSNGVNLLPPSQTTLLDQLGNVSAYTVALTLSWTPFDRLLTHLNVEQAEVNKLNLEFNQDDLRLQIIAQVRQAREDFEAATRQLESAQVGMRAAQKAYDVIQGRYKVGSSTFVDILTSQSALVQAQSARAQAEVNVKLQERALEYALGS